MAAANVYYDVAMRRLDAQVAQIDQLDSKVASIFAAASGILAIFAGLLALVAIPANLAVRVVLVATMLVAGIVYSVLLYNLYHAYKVMSWHFRPDLPTLRTHSSTLDEATVQEWVANECAQSFQDNSSLIARKAECLKRALVALPIESVLLVLAGVIIVVVK